MNLEQQALELIAERDALKAKIELWDEAFYYYLTNNKSTDKLINAFNKTPDQCINSIKADAIEFAAEQINGQCDGEVCYEILMNNAYDIRGNNG